MTDAPEMERALHRIVSETIQTEATTRDPEKANDVPPLQAIRTSPAPDEDERGSAGLPAGMDGLRYILTIAPMLGLFNRVAQRVHGHKKRGNAFAQLKQEHRRFFWTCVFIDGSIRSIAALALLAFVIAVGYKALK